MHDDSNFEYERLGPEQRAQIIERRLQQYEAEHFEHSLNRKALEQATDLAAEEKVRQLAQIDTALENLERSIELHRVELDRLLAGDA